MRLMASVPDRDGKAHMYIWPALAEKMNYKCPHSYAKED